MPAPAAPAGPVLDLGGRRFEVGTHALVMGILNRTPDSFFDRGAHFAMPAFVDRAARLVAEGADVLDVGGVKAGPGPEVGEEEEIERVVPAIEQLRRRFEVPVSVDTWRAGVARLAYRAGAVLGNDISGFADPAYLPEAAAAGAAVVATHIRLAPRVPDPQPSYRDLLGEVEAFLLERAARAAAAGIPADRVVLDAGLDLGKTWQQSVALLRASQRFAGHGHVLLLSASNKTFLGALLGLEVGDRRQATAAALAVGVVRGARLLRVHDVAGAVRIRDTLAPLLAGAGATRSGAAA